MPGCCRGGAQTRPINLADLREPFRLRRVRPVPPIARIERRASAITVVGAASSVSPWSAGPGHVSTSSSIWNIHRARFSWRRCITRCRNASKPTPSSPATERTHASPLPSPQARTSAAISSTRFPAAGRPPRPRNAAPAAGTPPARPRHSPERTGRTTPKQRSLQSRVAARASTPSRASARWRSPLPRHESSVSRHEGTGGCVGVAAPDPTEKNRRRAKAECNPGGPRPPASPSLAAHFLGRPVRPWPYAPSARAHHRSLLTRRPPLRHPLT